MKRLTCMTFALLLLAGGISAQDVTGEMRINGYLGYGIGFGDAFESIELLDTEYSFGPNFNLGGQFFYGLSEGFMIGGELYMQNYTAKVEEKTTGLSVSESEFDLNVLANGLLVFNYTDENALFGIGGLGIYDGEIGLSGGVIYQTAVSENITLFGMPRLHLIMADPSGFILQLAVGITFPIGPSY